MGNYCEKHVFKHVTRDFLTMYPFSTRENDTCLHLLSCCTIKYINNLCTSQHNKVVHEIAQTLLARPTTRCFALINVGHIKDKLQGNVIPSWLLPCSCYLPRCSCLAIFCPDMVCLLGTTLSEKPSFAPQPNLKVELIGFTYRTDRFSQIVTSRTLEKYVTLQHASTQQG